MSREYKLIVRFENHSVPINFELVPFCRIIGMWSMVFPMQQPLQLHKFTNELSPIYIMANLMRYILQANAIMYRAKVSDNSLDR